MLKHFLILLFLTFFLSCLFGPVIYSGLLTAWPEFPWPYSRVYDRVVLVVVIGLFWYWRKKLEVPPLRFNPVSYLRINGRMVLAGLILSTLASAFAVTCCIYAGSIAVVHPNSSVVFTKGSQALLTAAIVSVLEELIFRGVVYLRLAAQIGHIRGALVSSALYATVHFIAPERSFTYPGWSLLIGFDYFGVIVGNLASVGVATGLFGLFLVGLVLAESVRRTGSLALALGLHAGWIIALKSSLFLTRVSKGVHFPHELGRRYFFVAQPATWASAIIIWVLIVCLIRQNQNSDRTW